MVREKRTQEASWGSRFHRTKHIYWGFWQWFWRWIAKSKRSGVSGRQVQLYSNHRCRVLLYKVHLDTLAFLTLAKHLLIRCDMMTILLKHMITNLGTIMTLLLNSTSKTIHTIQHHLYNRIHRILLNDVLMVCCTIGNSCASLNTIDSSLSFKFAYEPRTTTNINFDLMDVSLIHIYHLAILFPIAMNKEDGEKTVATLTARRRKKGWKWPDLNIVEWFSVIMNWRSGQYYIFPSLLYHSTSHFRYTCTSAE